MTNYRVKDWIETRPPMVSIETRQDRILRGFRKALDVLAYLSLAAWVFVVLWGLMIVTGKQSLTR